MNAKEFKTKVLDKLNKVYDKKQTIDQFSKLHINNGVFCISSPEATVKIKTDFTQINGSVCFSQLYKAFTKLKTKPFSLSATDKELIIDTTGGRLKFALSIVNQLEFNADYTPAATLNASDAALIAKAVVYTANDELRPVMNCVFIDKEGFIVGSDAHVLGYYKTDAEINSSVIIPKNVCKLVDKGCEISASNSGDFKLISDDMEVCWHLRERYPNWQAVIPKNSLSFKISTKELSDSLELALLQSNSESKMCRFVCAEGVALQSACIDSETSFGKYFDVDMRNFGGSMEIGFSGTRLTTIIKNEKCENMTFSFSDPSRAIVMNDNVLLMPMMIE